MDPATRDLVYGIFTADSETIIWWQMVARGTVIFLIGMILVRLAGKRAFGGIAPFDVVLAVILGSTLSRTLTGNTAFVSGVATSVALVLAHNLVAALAYRSNRFGALVKGREVRLVADGEPDRDAMRRTRITERDLLEELRLREGAETLAEIEKACIERNGSISFLKRR